MADLRTDDEMAEYVRDHRCWRADPDVTLADWDRGVAAIAAQALAAEPTESLDAAWAAAEPWGLNERPDLTDDLRWEAHRGITYEYGPTPIAALNALSQALRSEQDKSEEQERG